MKRAHNRDNDLRAHNNDNDFDDMDPIIFTPRLKLQLITKAEKGSQELEWLHELRSDPQSMWWR